MAGDQFKAEFLPADIPVPGGNILVGEPWGDIEHDDGTLAIDAVQLKHISKKLCWPRLSILALAWQILSKVI
jgi:hypothetical protein